MSEGFAFVSSQDTTLVFLSVLSISYMHAASGLFSWSMELLAFASRQFAPKIVDLSVRFIRFFFFAIFFLVSERSGRWKPSAERSALSNPENASVCLSSWSRNPERFSPA